MPEFFVWPLAFSIPLAIWIVSSNLERRRSHGHLRGIAHLFEGALVADGGLTGALGGGAVSGQSYGGRTAVKVQGARWLPPGALLRAATPEDQPGLESAAWATEGSGLFWAALGSPPAVLEAKACVFALRPDGWVLSAPHALAEDAVEAAVHWTTRAAMLTAGGESAWVAACLRRLALRGSPTTAVFLLHRLWPTAANDDALRQQLEQTLATACNVAPADDWSRVATTVWSDLTAAAS